VALHQMGSNRSGVAVQNVYRCAACGVDSSGLISYQQHIQGKAHYKRAGHYGYAGVPLLMPFSLFLLLAATFDGDEQWVPSLFIGRSAPCEVSACGGGFCDRVGRSSCTEREMDCAVAGAALLRARARERSSVSRNCDELWEMQVSCPMTQASFPRSTAQ